MSCVNGNLIDNYCKCNNNYSNEDDFFSSTIGCPINITVRFYFINFLLVIASINTIMCVGKLIYLLKTYKDKNINFRFLYSVFFTLFHYILVIIMCAFLQNKKMNDNLSTLITGSLAFAIGCTEQSLHLVEILILYARSFAIKQREIKSQSSITRLQHCVFIVSVLAGVNWFFWSVYAYIVEKNYWPLFFMWLGLSITTFIWGICFMYYGTKALFEISSILKSHKRDDIEIISGRLKTVIYLYTFISFFISSVSLVIILVEYLYVRTIYIYTFMGSILGIVDTIYIWIINITYESSKALKITRIVNKVNEEKVEQTIGIEGYTDNAPKSAIPSPINTSPLQNEININKPIPENLNINTLSPIRIIAPPNLTLKSNTVEDTKKINNINALDIAYNQNRQTMIENYIRRARIFSQNIGESTEIKQTVIVGTFLGTDTLKQETPKISPIKINIYPPQKNTILGIHANELFSESRSNSNSLKRINQKRSNKIFPLPWAGAPTSK